MAKKTINRKPDCKHSYDPHNESLDGHFVLCRCSIYTDRIRLMTRDGCNQFLK